MKVPWRIYYGDGSVYEGDPFLAPQTDVQVVVQSDTTEKGWHLCHGRDYYIWREGQGWVNPDMGGFWDYLMMYRGPKAILFGRTIRDEDFFSVIGEASKKGLD